MSDPFAGLSEPFLSISRELSFSATGGPYAGVEDLLTVDDLAWVDISVKRWMRDGTPLRLRVKALSFDQQERIDRACMITLKDGRVVKSEARFAAATIRECCVVPTLNDAQAREMTAHNPAIMSAITSLVWNVLSLLDQEAINALVIQDIPDAGSTDTDAQSDDHGAGESADDSDVGDPYGFVTSGDPIFAEVAT